MKNIDFKDFRRFKATLIKSLSFSKRFKIMCQNYETKEIETALKFGDIKSCDGKDCKIIEGPVSEELIMYFKNLEKTESSDKVIPFYSLILDDNIYFENYATQNYIK